MAGEFNTGAPVGHFLTWTTYGTWLPGDSRGWNRKGDESSLPPNSLFHEMAVARMKEKPFLLSEHDRKVVANTIDAHCEIRQWVLHAANVRSNHVHIVVSSNDYAPDQVAAQFKAWASRKLKSAHKARKRFWTEGSSCRWLNSDDQLAKAIQYTLEAQDRKGVQ